MDVLSAAKEVIAVRPYFEESHLSRIPDVVRGEWGNRSRHAVAALLNRRVWQLGESVAYRLHNALICRGQVFCGHLRHDLKHPPKRELRLPWSCSQAEVGVLAHSHFSAVYWAHWLWNELPMQFRLQRYGDLLGYLPRTAYRDEGYWRAELELPPILQAEAWDVKELTVVNGTGFDIDTIRQYHRIRQIALRKPKGHDRVFLMRGETGSRRVLRNQAEVATHLEREGFYCVDVAKASGEEIASAMRGAAVVVSVEGSHLAPATYTLAAGGLLVTLQPPWRIDLHENERMPFCGISLAVYVCHAAGNGVDEFVIDVEDMLRFIERCTAWSQANSDHIIDYAASIVRE